MPAILQKNWPLQLADVWTMHLALARGAVEANPMTAAGRCWWVLKLAIALMAARLIPLRPRWLAWTMALMAVVVIWNLRNVLA
jgi:hypothetical protein